MASAAEQYRRQRMRESQQRQRQDMANVFGTPTAQGLIQKRLETLSPDQRRGQEGFYQNLPQAQQLSPAQQQLNDLSISGGSSDQMNALYNQMALQRSGQSLQQGLPPASAGGAGLGRPSYSAQPRSQSMSSNGVPVSDGSAGQNFDYGRSALPPRAAARPAAPQPQANQYIDDREDDDDFDDDEAPSRRPIRPQSQGDLTAEMAASGRFDPVTARPYDDDFDEDDAPTRPARPQGDLTAEMAASGRFDPVTARPLQPRGAMPSPTIRRPQSPFDDDFDEDDVDDDDAPLRPQPQTQSPFQPPPQAPPQQAPPPISSPTAYTPVSGGNPGLDPFGRPITPRGAGKQQQPPPTQQPGYLDPGSGIYMPTGRPNRAPARPPVRPVQRPPNDYDPADAMNYDPTPNRSRTYF